MSLISARSILLERTFKSTVSFDYLLSLNWPDSTPYAHEGAGQLKAETKALELCSLDAHVLLNDVAPEAELHQLRFQVVLQHVVLGVHYAGQIKRRHLDKEKTNLQVLMKNIFLRFSCQPWQRLELSIK